MIIKTADNLFALAGELTDELITEISEITARKSHITIALAGGATPIVLYHRLKFADIPWKDVTFILGDERLGKDNNRLNLNMVKKFLGHPNLNLLDLRDFDGLPPKIDIAIVGMGDDGHTLSIFPDLEPSVLHEIFNGNKLIMEVEPPTQSEKRLTLTKKSISHAEYIHVLFKGNTKKKVLDNALNEKKPFKYPIYGILEDRCSITTIWWTE